jgi:hypothetical protein
MADGFSASEASRFLGALLFRLTDSIDTASSEERRFGIGLLHLAALNEDGPLIGFEERASAFGATIRSQASMAELLRLSSLMIILGRDFEAEQLKAFAFAKPILTGIDASNYRAVKASDGQFAQAVPVLLDFYQQPDANFGRRGFLEMMCGPGVTQADRQNVFTKLALGPAKDRMSTDEVDALLKLALRINKSELMQKALELASLALRNPPDHVGLVRRACNLAVRVPPSPITSNILDTAERALQMMAGKRLATDRRLVIEAGRLIADRANRAQAARAFASVTALVDVDERPPSKTLLLFYPWVQSDAPPSRQLAMALMRRRAAAGKASDIELAILKWKPTGR